MIVLVVGEEVVKWNVGFILINRMAKSELLSLEIKINGEYIIAYFF